MNDIPSYKNLSKGGKVLAWIGLLVWIALILMYFIGSGTSTCTQDPFYDSSCQQ